MSSAARSRTRGPLRPRNLRIRKLRNQSGMRIDKVVRGRTPRSAVTEIGLARGRAGERKAWALLFAGVLAGILTHRGLGASALGFKPEWVPSLAVPRMTRPPVLDGIIDPEEWREAAALSGVANVADNVLIPRPTTFYLAWDPDHLYLACRTYLRPGYRPAIWNGREDGKAYTFDDGMEFVWKPMGKNVVDRHAAYKFFVNCLGFKGDTSRLTLGQMFKDWNPQFKTAWRMTEPGTGPNGGRWWELEMSASAQDFELRGPHRAGDEWRMMLGFNHVPTWMQARIPCLGSYFDDSGGGYPRITLVENTPAVQLLMESLQNLATDGTADMKVRVFNPTAEEASVEILCDVAGALVRSETLRVPAGGEAAWGLSETLQPSVTNGLVNIQAVWRGKALLSYRTFFAVGYQNRMLAPVPPTDPASFEWDVKFNPVRRLLMISGDTWFLDRPEAAAFMPWRVYPEGDPGKPVATGRADRLVLWRFQQLVQLPELAPGRYTVEGSLAMKDGTVRGPRTATIEKKDEAKEFAAWWDKNFGDSEQVLPPFDPVRPLPGSRSGFRCWGREYLLTSLGLPAEIRSQGRSVLASSSRVMVRLSGREIQVPLSTPEIIEARDWRVRFRGRTEAEGLAFEAEGWLEQDGLVYVELTYGPTGAEPIVVEELRLEYPLVDEEAECLVCIGPGGNFASMSAMLLPAEKKGSLWSTLVTGRPGSRMTQGNFYPTVWVGNERCGFLWWGDNDQGWFPEDDVPAHEVLRLSAQGASPGTSCVLLRNTLIGKPVPLTEKRTVAFSYMATPFRPLTKGWRMVGATEDGTFFRPHRSVRKDSRTGEPVNKGGRQMNWIHPESRYPEEWDALWAEQKTNAMCLGFKGADACVRERQWYDPYAARSGVSWQHMSFTLFGWGPKSIEDHLYRYFAPGGDWDDEYDESFIRYALYLFDGAFGKGGVVQTYFDITFPTLNENPVSGLCYLLPDGRIQPGYVGWNVRRFFQRLQALMAKHGLVPGGHGGHSTQAYLTIAMPWMDAVLDGELNFNLDVSDRNWVDYYPIARLRSMSCPHQWGVPICWMGNLDSTDKHKVGLAQTQRAEYLWLHDSWKNPYAGAGRTDMPDTILDFGLNGDATAYHPYWRNPYVRASDKDLLVSVWRLDDHDDLDLRAVPTTGRVERVLIGVFNYHRKDTKDVMLSVDLNALGFDATDTTVVAQELYGPENASTAYYKGSRGSHTASGLFGMECRWHRESGTLRLAPLPPHRGRFVGLRLERAAEVARLEAVVRTFAERVRAPVPVEVPETVINWGAVDSRAVWHEEGQVPGVSPLDPTTRVAAWVLPDRVLLLAATHADKAVDARIKVDLDALHLTPRLVWQEFIRVRDFGRPAAGAILDFHGRELTIRSLAPRTVRLIGIRRY